VQISLIRALLALGVVLIGLNVASAIWDIHQARVATESRAQRDFSNLTRLLAEETAATLEAVDVVLRNAALNRQAVDPTQAPSIASFLVLDERGRITGRTGATPSLGDDPAALPLFTVHRDATAQGVYVSDPYQGGPVGATWRLVLSRRVSDAAGGFAGVVAAAIDIDRFDRLYRSIDLGEGGFITLISTDGMVIARVPDPVGARGRRFALGENQPSVARGGQFSGWTVSPVIEERVLQSTAEVRGFPLRVAIGGTEKAVLAPWREEAWMLGLRTLLVSAAMLALIALATWGLARRERALQRNERRFRAMIEHSSDGLLLTRPDQGIIYISPAFARDTGYTLEELRGRQPYELLHPEHRERVLSTRPELLSTPGKVVTRELLAQMKDGSTRWIESTVTNLLHEPSVRALVMNFRDIHERKLAEGEHARLAQRLRQAEKMEAVGRLAGGIAHDFNNILGGIHGYAEMLVETLADGSPQKRYAHNVLAAANRASHLVEQILSYSRSQRGRKMPVMLERVVAETVELVQGSLPTGIRLQATLPSEPLCVVGDPTQLHQITMNLCTNAIHAMADGGTLAVTLDAVELTAERPAGLVTLHAGRYARLAVEDTGIGMDEATLARVFEPFFTTKEVGKGTGLGLSLVYGIVTDAEGAIEVSSAPGRGSRFEIYLPRVDAPGIPESEDAAPVVRGNGERVLVVDDEEALVALTGEVLKRLGYEPLGFADGEAALAAFEAAPDKVDAVVADEVMPGISGTELAATLRARRAGLPFVLMSGYIGPMMTERARAAGVMEILKKPVQSRDLAAALARALKTGTDPFSRPQKGSVPIFQM
jgi:PAS domain S-box-containing protein